MKKIILVISLLFTQQLFAQLLPSYGGQRAGLSTLSFLKYDINPISSSMSGASVALNGDIFGLLTNPAGLTTENSLQIGLVNNNIISGVNQSFFGIATPVGKQTIGLQVNSLYTSAMKVRTEFQPNGTGELFYFSSSALGLTYAKDLSDMFSFGMTFKYIFEQVANYNNSTVAVDLGFLYKTDFKDLKFAVNVQNFGGNSSINGDDLGVDFNRDPTTIKVNEYTVPTVFSLGFSLVPIKNDKHSLLTAFQLNHPTDNAENLRFGFEYNYRELLYLRTGVKINVKGQQWPTFGIGYRMRLGAHPLKLNYSFIPTNYIGIQHSMGLNFVLNKMER